MGGIVAWKGWEVEKKIVKYPTEMCSGKYFGEDVSII